ncbi:MAG: sulfide/dihydroorotate dehydrogenase-like FAD/NAD-binding protein [Actinobacteria bacterium]|nr:MAG: sulfide/dihydroorotate dehydrogenase-like FAD/NAD-binding protein [Actinomycetota bacterium]
MDRRFAICGASTIGPDIVRLVVEAPRVAAHAQPGQFVIVRVNDHGERIPLTICDSDPEAGTITLVVQAVGSTTTQLNVMTIGEHLADVLGPLGTPTGIDRFGACVVVAGGVGTAIVLPVARALTRAGNRVTAIVGARNEDHLILLNEMRDATNEVIITTDDGSAGRHGLVTDALGTLLAEGDVDYVFTAGPIPMMQAVAGTTRDKRILTVASLNPLMVDGTGMCGGCRVTVGGESKFACIDGPDFDAHAVDFITLSKRNTAYLEFESCRFDEATEAIDA